MHHKNTGIRAGDYPAQGFEPRIPLSNPGILPPHHGSRCQIFKNDSIRVLLINQVVLLQNDSHDADHASGNFINF